jgi:hypothetical protein
MNDVEYAKYLDDKYNEIPKEFLVKCVEFLKNEIQEETKDEIYKAYQDNGLNWIGVGHFHFGMYIRNKLRSAGFLDECLPDGNWDDYYIQVLEDAVGIR